MLPSRPFALNDKDKEFLDDYCDRMSWFTTRGTRILPLEEGLTFDLALAPPTDVGGVDAGRPSVGRLRAMATYVLVKALQQGPRYQSQVWLARPTSTSSGPATTMELVFEVLNP